MLLYTYPGEMLWKAGIRDHATDSSGYESPGRRGDQVQWTRGKGYARMKAILNIVMTMAEAEASHRSLQLRARAKSSSFGAEAQG